MKETKIYPSDELYQELQSFWYDNPDLFCDEEGCLSFSGWLTELVGIGFNKVKESQIKHRKNHCTGIHKT